MRPLMWFLLFVGCVALGVAIANTFSGDYSQAAAYYLLTIVLILIVIVTGKGK